MLTLLTYEPIGHLNNHSHNSYVLEHQERIAAVLLVAVMIAVIIAHLFLGTLGKQPFARPFTNNSDDGELVSMTGTINQLVPIQNGGHLNVYTGTVTVFIPAPVAQKLTLRKGDTISVYGIVQTYHGKKEVVVSSAEDVSLILGNTLNDSSTNT
jgi:hypothetical protein